MFDGYHFLIHIGFFEATSSRASGVGRKTKGKEAVIYRSEDFRRVEPGYVHEVNPILPL